MFTGRLELRSEWVESGRDPEANLVIPEALTNATYVYRGVYLLLELGLTLGERESTGSY